VCGIAGVISADGRPVDEGALRAMAERLRHRGPDSGGSWSEGPCHLVHRRLRILDLDDRADQPMASADGRWVIVYNGEVYNFEALRDELAGLGRGFRTRSDTEVVLQAWQQWGVDCLPRLRGMFAFAIWDRRERSLTLCRDRIGKKPLFYAEGADGMAFASELKAIAALPGFDDALDVEALGQYLLHGYVNAPATIYRSVRKLPPGHWLRLAEGRCELRCWHRTDFLPKLRLDEEEATDELERHLSEATRLRMISDVPLGAFLSGGVDSSLIVALMAQAGPRVKTFTMGFEQADYNELEHARVLAERYGTEHVEAVVTPDAAALLPRLVHHFDEPFADASAVPTFLLSEMTRRSVTVALNGDGGDELLAGYKRYEGMWYSTIYDALPRWLRARVVGPLLEPVPENTRMNSFVRNLKWLNRSSLLPLETRYLQTFGFFAGEHLDSVLGEQARRRIGAPGSPYAEALARTDLGLVDRLMLGDLHAYLPGDVIVKTERMSMAVSLEARSPLLDQEVVAFSARLPTEFKFRRGRLKRLLKRVAERHVPSSLVHRRKQGFGVPVGSWFRNELSGFLRDHLMPSRLAAAGLLSQPGVDRLVDEHVSGRRNHQGRLWALLMLELWSRQFPWSS
jgi:asparagine synthase (glutamine-hydrolysing)